jgi:hypothetical protein
LLNAIVPLRAPAASFHNDQLVESFHTLRSQLLETDKLQTRQKKEAEETIDNAGRKFRLAELVDKLTALKAAMRFSEESNQRVMYVKEMVRQKIAAFQLRLQRQEQRQALER